MAAPALLEARGITKRFGHVEALGGVDFEAHAGQVTALIGDNGAGKSTFVKIMSGAMRADEGETLVEGRNVAFGSPQDAHDAGIETVYQDLSVAPDLAPPANVFMGRELLRAGWLGRLGFLDKPAMRKQSEDAFRRLQVTLKDIDAPLASLSGGQRQSVTICRSVLFAKRVLFMDEPTAALGVLQTRRTLDLIRRIRDLGLAVVLISHNMRDVLEVADGIEVLRLGRRVARLRGADATLQDLVGAMTGGVAA